MPPQGPGLIFFVLLWREMAPNLSLVLAEERPPNLGFSRFPHLEGVMDPALLNFFSNFFSEIKLEIPWEFLIWWGSDLGIQGVESQDFVFWAFDPPPNGKFPGNFPFGGGSSGPPPNGKVFEFWILKSSK